jgi:flagellar hook-associated protein 3
MRVTNQFITSSLINQINRSNASLNSQQVKISSGKAYLTTSENPTNNALAMEYKNSINEKKQYVTNIESANDWYKSSDSSLTNVESIIQRARELAVEGANGVWEETDYVGMAAEIDELIAALVDVANTQVGDEYIFGGARSTTSPISILDGAGSGLNTNLVTIMGDVLSNINAARPVAVTYTGSQDRLTAQIDSSTIIEKSITALEMFFGGSGVNTAPTYTEIIPPLEGSTMLSTLNSGNGVQLGTILISDHAGVVHEIDLSAARTLDDVLSIISESGNFEAGIDEMPSDTAVSLGLFRTAGNSALLEGLSLGPLLNGLPYTINTPLTSLNQGQGVAGGYLNINTSDGMNFRVDISGCTTIGDVVNAITAVDGGSTLQASFNLEHQRFEIKDLTGGRGDFSINSTKNQLYVKDLGSNTAMELGLLKNAGVAGNIIYADYQQATDSAFSPLSGLNNGKGVGQGNFTLSNHAGNSFVVDVTKAVTQQDVVDAINLASDGTFNATFDTATNRIVITDTSVGTGEFKIEEYRGNQALSISDTSSVANNLGLLKSTNGNTLAGNPLIDSNTNNLATLATNLSDLTPPITLGGNVIIKSGNNSEMVLDLSDCVTINDVLGRFNATGAYTAAFDPNNGTILISNPSAPMGSGITIEEVNNTARDLGLITGATNTSSSIVSGAPLTVAALPTLEGSVDLNPFITGATMLHDLNDGMGVTLGTIRIVDKAGDAANIDLRGCQTVQDVLNKLNDPNNGIYVEARINADGNGFEIVDKNRGAVGRLTITDTDNNCAKTLGISGWTYDNSYVGKDLDPALTLDTPLSILNGSGIPTGKVYVQSGDYSCEIDLTECKTVGDVIDKLSNTDYNLGLQAWISPDGKHLNLTNTKGMPYIKLTDLDGSGMCETIGFANSSGLFATLVDLRDNMLRGDAKAISNISIAQLDVDLKRVVELHTEVGAKTNRVTYTKEKHENIILNLKESLGNVEDIDMVEAIIQMTEMEMAYQAALQVGARIMQLSLLDFLR